MSDFLIQVSAEAQGSKHFKVTLKNYLDGSTIPLTTTMEVQPGDRLAWNLQVVSNGTVYNPAFQVNFFGSSGASDSSFFGQSAISAASGQTTQFLTVLALQEIVKYTVVADGFGQILDPKIQTGDGTDGIGFTPAGNMAPTYTVIWNYPDTYLYYQAGQNPAQPFPPSGLTVNLKDTVAFVANVTGDPPTQGLNAVFAFDATHFWISPFTQSQQDLPFSVPPNAINAYEVVDRIDPAGTVFSFNGQTDDGSIVSETRQFILG